MNNIVANKLIYNLDRVAGDQRPITAEIFLTNYCNNRCVYCRYKHAVGEYIDFDTFVLYAGRLLDLGVKGIILTGGGEPTINPDFDRITAWLEEHGVPYGINTNFNIYKEFKPKYLKVSLDAIDAEDYSSKRGVKRQIYDKVLSNIGAYIEWRNTHGIEATVGIQIVVKKSEEIKAFYDAHRHLAVDYMSFRPIESEAGLYYNGEDISKFIVEMEELKKTDSRVLVNYKWNMMGVKFPKCFANWSVITIDHKGNVLYCCQKPTEIVGHVLDPDILDKKRVHKTDMRLCEVPCRLSGANKFLEEISKGGKDVEFI